MVLDVTLMSILYCCSKTHLVATFDPDGRQPKIKIKDGMVSNFNTVMAKLGLFGMTTT